MKTTRPRSEQPRRLSATLSFTYPNTKRGVVARDLRVRELGEWADRRGVRLRVRLG